MGGRRHVDHPGWDALRVAEYKRVMCPRQQYDQVLLATKDLPPGFAYPPEGFRFTTPAGYPGRYLDPNYRCSSCLKRWWGRWKELSAAQLQKAVDYHNRHAAPGAVQWTLDDMQDKRWDWVCDNCACAITLVPRMGGAEGLVNSRYEF